MLNRKDLLDRLIHIILPLSVFLGSLHVLALSLISTYGRFSSAAAGIAGLGILTGLPTLIDNIRRISKHKRARFFFGTGSKINELSLQDRLVLTRLADEAHYAFEKKIRPNFVLTLKKIFSLRGLILMAAGGLVTFWITGSSNWIVLAVAAMSATMLPYLLSVLYAFFCSDIERYKFRTEFFRQYFENAAMQKGLRSKLLEAEPPSEFCLQVRSSWNYFALRFPITAGIVAFILVKLQIVFWGNLLGLALLPFSGIGSANYSAFIDILRIFPDLLKSESGYRFYLQVISVFNNLGFAFTRGDFIRLGIIALGLSIASLLGRIKRFGLRTPIYGFGKLGANFVHLWLIVAIVGAITPWNLAYASQMPATGLSQSIHRIFGGKEDIALWHKASLLNRQMQIDPAGTLQMDISEQELQFLLEQFKAEKEIKIIDSIRNNPNSTLQDKQEADAMALLLKQAEQEIEDDYSNAVAQDKETTRDMLDAFENKYREPKLSLFERSRYGNEALKEYEKKYEEAYQKEYAKYKEPLSMYELEREKQHLEKLKKEKEGLAKKQIKPEDPDMPLVRQFALFLLAEKGTPHAKEIINSFVSDRDDDVRTMALIYSSKSGNQQAAEALAKVAFKQGGWPQPEAILNLNDSKTPEVTSFLFNSLNHSERSDIRYAALKALSNRVDQPNVKDALVWGLGDPSPQVRLAAIQGVTPWADATIMEKIKPFLTSTNFSLHLAAIESVGSRLDTFPGNIDLLTPGLKDKDSNIALTTIDVLGPQIPKFEQQLKQPFIDIARNNSFPIEARQNSIIHLSGVNAPEIKTLLVDNLENDDWQMRQAATLGLGLGNFKDPAIPTLFAPRVRDPQWQVRQATAISLGNLGQPKTIRYFKPLSNDSNLEVRRAGTLALATNLKKFPELRQPLMDKYRDSFEDKMVRFVAMKSLQNDGYELTEPSVDDLHKIGQDQAGEYDWVLRDAGLSMYEALSSTFGVPKLDRTFGISWSKSVKGAGIAYSGFNESLSVNRIRSTERMSNIFGTILGVVPIVNTFIRISSAKTSEERYSAVRGTPAWSIGAAVKVVNDIEIPKTIGQSARSVPNLNQFKSWSTYRTNSQFTARQFIPTPNIQAPSINSWNNRSFQSIPKIPSIPKFNYQPPPPVLFKMPPPINSFQRPQLYQRPIWQQPRFTPIQPYKPLPTAPPMMTAPTAPSFNFSAPRF